MRIWDNGSLWFDEATKNYGGINREYMEKNRLYLKQNGINVFVEFMSKEKFDKFLEKAKSDSLSWNKTKIFVIDTSNPVHQNIWRRYIR